MKRLMRVWYRTDIAPIEDGGDPDYVGTFSDPFPENEAWRIVDVDWSRVTSDQASSRRPWIRHRVGQGLRLVWSTPGEVQVTYLIPSTN